MAVAYHTVFALLFHSTRRLKLSKFVLISFFLLSVHQYPLLLCLTNNALPFQGTRFSWWDHYTLFKAEDSRNYKMSSKSVIEEIEAEDIDKFIHGSTTKFVYFESAGSNHSDNHFVNELEKATFYLKSRKYGVQIAKVECKKISTLEYCDKANHGNFIAMRDGKILSLALDTLKNYHAIIANILHILLIDEIPLLESIDERTELEKFCVGQCNISLLYLKDLGTYEHQAFLEIAFSNLNKYQWAVTTNYVTTDGLKKPPSFTEDGWRDTKRPLLWILHCQDLKMNVSLFKAPCPNYLNQGIVTKRSIKAFTDAAELPPWSVAKVAQGKPVTIYNSLPIPIVYVIWDNSCGHEIAIRKAEKLGKFFKGNIGICTLQKELLDVKSNSLEEVVQTPAIAFDHRDNKVKMAVLIGFMHAYQFIQDQLLLYQSTNIRYFKSEIEESKDFEHKIVPQTLQDDPVAIAVQHAKFKPDLSHVFNLTNETTLENVTAKHLCVLVMYYVEWDPLCKAAFYTLASTARRLKNFSRAVIARMDCFDWSDICEKHNITSYPTVLIYKKDHSPRLYDEVFEASEISRSLILSRDFKAHLPFMAIFKTSLGHKNGDPTPVKLQSLENLTVREAIAIIKYEDLGILPELTMKSLDVIKEKYEFVSIFICIRNANDITVITETAREVKGSGKIRNTFLTWMDANSYVGANLLKHYSMSEEEIQLITLNFKEGNVYLYPGKNWTKTALISWLTAVEMKMINATRQMNKGHPKPLQKDFDHKQQIRNDELSYYQKQSQQAMPLKYRFQESKATTSSTKSPSSASKFWGSQKRQTYPDPKDQEEREKLNPSTRRYKDADLHNHYNQESHLEL